MLYCIFSFYYENYGYCISDSFIYLYHKSILFNKQIFLYILIYYKKLTIIMLVFILEKNNVYLFANFPLRLNGAFCSLILSNRLFKRKYTSYILTSSPSPFTALSIISAGKLKLSSLLIPKKFFNSSHELILITESSLDGFIKCINKLWSFNCL